MKLIIKYCILISGILAINGYGLEAFYFPEYLHKKVIKQIKRTFNLDEFDTQPIILDSVMYSDIMLILDANQTKVGYGVVTLANGCKIGGCMNPSEIDPETQHEQFYFLTLYDTQANILNIKVLEYTSQYGYEITARSWLNQFAGKKAGDLTIGKEIDGISGATISVRSIVNEINHQQTWIEHSLLYN